MSKPGPWAQQSRGGTTTCPSARPCSQARRPTAARCFSSRKPADLSRRACGRAAGTPMATQPRAGRHKPTQRAAPRPAAQTPPAAPACAKAARARSPLHQLPGHLTLPKGHPSSCLVKLLIIKWHVHLMIKLLHQEHERLRRTN